MLTRLVCHFSFTVGPRLGHYLGRYTQSEGLITNVGQTTGGKQFELRRVQTEKKYRTNFFLPAFSEIRAAFR